MSGRMESKKTHGQHRLFEFLFMHFILLQPSFRPPELSVLTKHPFMPIHHIWTPADGGSGGQIVSEDRNATFWHDALEG